VVESTMDVSEWLRKQLEQASPDLLRAMVQDFAEALMGAEADALCGAPYGERSPERLTKRNGYREREWDTRVGTIELAIPRLRAGSYFPDWLLQPRRRAEQAFVSVIADADLAGVSTRRVEKLVQQLGVERMSRSRVSRLAKSLDQMVEDFRTRPLEAGPYPYLVLDALEVKCREGGAHRQRLRRPRRRRQPRRLPGVARTRRRHERGRGGLARLPALAGRPRAQRRPPGYLGRAHRARRRDRGDAAGSELATVPDALHAQPAHPRPQERAELRRDHGALDLRPARRRVGARPAGPHRRPARGPLPGGSGAAR
jgi:Transposase, Mutator family